MAQRMLFHDFAFRRVQLSSPGHAQKAFAIGAWDGIASKVT